MGNYGGDRELYGNVRVSDAEQREHDKALIAKRTVDIPTNMQHRLDYGARTDGQPDYEGFGVRGLAAGSAGWLIYKYTYSGDPGDMTLRQTAYHDWTDRANGSFA